MEEMIALVKKTGEPVRAGVFRNNHKEPSKLNKILRAKTNLRRLRMLLTTLLMIKATIIQRMVLPLASVMKNLTETVVEIQEV
jgi:hypothetical protein